MKHIFTAFTILISICSFTQPAGAQARHPKTFKMDSFTIKQYYFVMLTTGKEQDKIKDTNLTKKLQEGHMANIRRLYSEGKLLLVGPFGDNGNWQGIFVFDCDTQEEVEELLATDPKIKAGVLGYEIHPWWTGMNSVFK